MLRYQYDYHLQAKWLTLYNVYIASPLSFNRSVVQVRQCINEKGERVIYYSIPQNMPNQEQLRQELLSLRTPAPQNLRSLAHPQVCGLK